MAWTYFVCQATVLEEMPPFAERESSILAKLKKNRPDKMKEVLDNVKEPKQPIVAQMKNNAAAPPPASQPSLLSQVAPSLNFALIAVCFQAEPAAPAPAQPASADLLGLMSEPAAPAAPPSQPASAGLIDVLGGLGAAPAAPPPVTQPLGGGAPVRNGLASEAANAAGDDPNRSELLMYSAALIRAMLSDLS